MAWFLVIVLLAGNLCVPAVAAAGVPAAGSRIPAAGPRVPVILVHGGGSGPASWGIPTGGGRGTGFFRLLSERGYRPGETLFWLDYAGEADGDYAWLASERLAPLVEEAVRRSGSRQVDLIAQGMGALVGRHYIAALGGGSRVRTLAMIGPPNRGSFLLTEYRKLATLADQERLRRLQGLGRGKQLDEAALRTGFSDEPSYIDAVARGYFEPLYAQFVEEGLFLQRPSQPRRPESFESWFAGLYPADFREAFAAAQQPPGAEAGDGAGDGAGAGSALTRAYFNTLALAVAKNHYRQFAPWSGVLADGWRDDISLEGDWRAALWEFLRRRAEKLGKEAARRLGVSLGREALVAGGAALTGLSPGAPALYRLVSEEVWLGSGQYLANFGLAGLNRLDAEKRGLTRYITVAGLVPNLWAGLLPATGANDLIVEADSALLPPAPLDAYRLRSGWLGAVHARLNWQRDIQEFILRHLDPVGSVYRRHRPEAVRGRAPLSVSGPTLIGLDPGSSPYPEGVLEVEARPWGGAVSARGFQPFLVWQREGLVVSVQPLVREGGFWRASFDLARLQAGRDRLFLGARLIPADGGPPRVPQLLAPPRVTFEYHWQVGERSGEESPVGPAAGAEATGAEWAAGGAWGSSGVEPDRLGPGRPEPYWSEPVWSDPTALQRGSVPPVINTRDRTEKGIPEIEVHYRSKLTTDKKEDRTYHAEWQWDFGDGTRRQDDAPSPPESVADHRFAPGAYVVRARSVSNKGTILREVTWPVAVSPDDGGFRTFRAETVREPVPELRLIGPDTWIRGRSATFRIEASIPEVPFLEEVTATYYPAQTFAVRWHRPGTFTVRAALRLRLKYRFPEGSLVLYNNYVVTKEVEVVATTVTD